MRVSIPKGYLYFAMAFSVAVELVNLRLRARRDARRGRTDGH
jgi:predicted tellurium resistance membrane protein TerC